MLLTAKQLQEIRQIILDRHNAFAVSQYGPQAVAPQILQALKDKGLVDVDISTLQDAYVYGRIVQILGQSAADKMTYPQFKAYVKTNPQPLTSAEQHAVTLASQQAGALCQGLGNKLDKATGQILIEADAELRRKFEAVIRDKTAQNIAKRQSIKQLKSDLGHATGDWTRDLNRIAVTETQTAMQLGQARAISEQNGPDALVAKRSAPHCCDPCSAIYTGPDGAPRIFKLSALQATGTNQGRKANEYMATAGPLHPNCVPPGTMITTSLGPRAIEHVYPGDYVWTHKQRLRKVTHVWCQAYRGELCEIDSGWMTLRVTPNHLLYNGRSWRAAGEFKAGEHVVRDTSRPSVKDDPHLGSKYEDYVQVLHGQGPDSPFVALVLGDGVFMHEGFVYHRDRLSDGPCVPSLSGRLRFARASTPSIAGGDTLVLGDAQWIDDACERLIFRRVGVHMAQQLRSRCAPGPFARLEKNWSQSIAADAEVAGDSVQREAVVEMHAQDQIGFERLVAGTQHAVALDARAAGCSQGSAHDMTANAEHLGNRDNGHASVMKQSRDRLWVQVKAVAPTRYKSRPTHGEAQDGACDAQRGRYLVEGLVVVEMKAHHGVYVDLACNPGPKSIPIAHGKDVAQAAVISKVARKPYCGMVYNLTVEEDESYVAETFVTHNCRCILVAIPKGAGFNDKNQMSMIGTRGILTNPKTLEAEMAHKSMMYKAMEQGISEVSAFGLPVDVAKWAQQSEQGRWIASGSVPHPALHLNTLIGPDGTAGEVYIVHGAQSPDLAAMGFAKPLDAALAYQSCYPAGGIESMDAIGLSAFQDYLHGQERSALHAQRADVQHEKLVLSRNPAVDDSVRFRPNVPKRRQDIGGITEAFKDPGVFDQSTPLRFDKDANDIYRNTPQMPPRKLDVTTAVIPAKDLKLIIKRNKKRIKDREDANDAAAKLAKVGADNAAAFYGLGDKRDDANKPADAQVAEILETKAKPKREPVT
jgi:hypothetical protein